MKLFFAKSDSLAEKMMLEEFRNYDQIPAYHKTFEAAGVRRR
jgi:hypothetical protein